MLRHRSRFLLQLLVLRQSLLLPRLWRRLCLKVEMPRAKLSVARQRLILLERSSLLCMLSCDALVLPHNACRRGSQFTQVKRGHDAYLQAIPCCRCVAIFWSFIRILIVVLAFDEHSRLSLLVPNSILRLGRADWIEARVCRCDLSLLL